MKLKHYKAILFDSGRVLNDSASGHWFISPRFFEIINQERYKSIAHSKRNHAFSVAGTYIHSISHIQTKEEELMHFETYYSLFSESLPELNLSRSDIQALAQDLVYNTTKYTFYKDALNVVPKLYQTHKLGIVSDAWPSLIDVYTDAKLIHYFSSFVISSIIGVTKPNKLMYETALQALDVEACDTIFIDDNLKNCLGAKQMGIYPVFLCRHKFLYYIEKIRSLGRGYHVIHSLDQLI